MSKSEMDFLRAEIVPNRSSQLNDLKGWPLSLLEHPFHDNDQLPSLKLT